MNLTRTLPTTSSLDEIEAEVIIYRIVKRLTVYDNPNGSAVEPLLRQAAGTLCASRESVVD